MDEIIVDDTEEAALVDDAEEAAMIDDNEEAVMIIDTDEEAMVEDYKEEVAIKDVDEATAEYMEAAMDGAMMEGSIIENAVCEDAILEEVADDHKPFRENKTSVSAMSDTWKLILAPWMPRARWNPNAGGASSWPEKEA